MSETFMYLLLSKLMIFLHFQSCHETEGNAKPPDVRSVGRKRYYDMFCWLPGDYGKNEMSPKLNTKEHLN